MSGPTTTKRKTCYEAVLLMREAAYDAERAYFRELHDALPEGHRVAWVRGDWTQVGHVIRVCHDRVYVRNERTGKRVWISACQIEGMRL